MRYWLLAFKDPPSWNPEFRKKNWMYHQTVLLKLAGMHYIDFGAYLPANFAFISDILNWCIFGFYSFVHLHLACLFFMEMTSSADLTVITNDISMIIINVFAFFTLLYFKWNYKKYVRMVDYMDTHFLSRSAQGVTFMTGERSFVVASRYTIIWTAMCVQGTVQWLIVPLFSSTRILPIKVSYPFDALAEPYYGIIYFLHSMCQLLLALIYGNASTILACTVIIASGQFDILLCSLKNLRATALTLNGSCLKQLQKLQSKIDIDSEEVNQYYLPAELMDDVESNCARMASELERNPRKFSTNKQYLPQDTYLTELTEELNYALIACIKHNQMLVEFANILEDFFSTFVLLKSFQITFLICNLVFTIFKIEGTDFNRFVNVSQYLLLTSLDMFQLCYFGDTLKQQSSHIDDALLRSPWYLCGGPFRRLVSVVLANSTNPLVMTGGKFFVLDLYKLTSIMKASFSYFTLLRSLGK